ncbi:MAG: hypothetical protein ACO1NQ_14475 [Flavobacteriales bacterium]
MLRVLLAIGLIVLVFSACKKETPNPYDELERGDPHPTVDALPAGNFAWIHQRILRPNCALSGCHDGSFEPEFRTIGGSYNSLVLHPVIANDPQQSYRQVKTARSEATYQVENNTEYYLHVCCGLL